MSEYVFIKRRIDDGKFLPVVLVHGLNGTAHRTIDRTLAHLDRHLKVNTLLIFPTYTPPYQFVTGGLDRELLSEIGTFTRQKSDYHQKMCLYGFSAGAQFVHRFTYAHPDRVACCAALSAGSWTFPDGYYSDHPSRPGYITKPPYNTPEVHRQSIRKAKPGIDNVRWIVGCGRQDERYAKTCAFHSSLRKAASNARFISFNAGHSATPHLYKSVFREFSAISEFLP